MGSVVARWTGREARALREAKRMSVREFAAHLGVNDAAVSNWERRGTDARLRYDTQQLLDTDLTRSEPAVAERFVLILRSDGGDEPADPPAERTPSTGTDRFGARSGQRTAVLLETARTGTAEPGYRPDGAAVEAFRQFLDSPSRAFALAGRSGSGKTLLTRHLADVLSGQADFQFHSCSTWAVPDAGLATEILRYASVPGGEDPLLSLEEASAGLRRSCVVIIDGIDTEEQLTGVGRQVDGVLRQAASDRLRFVVVVRTPPAVDVSAFPVLAASTFGPAARPSVPSYVMRRWTPAEAREQWERNQSPEQPAFTELPHALQALVRTPLYLRMLHGSEGARQVGGEPGASNAFRLVDHCVRMVLTRARQDVEPTMDRLAELACDEAPEIMPRALAESPPRPNRAAAVSPAGAPVPALVERETGGRERFAHGVFRDYFLAVRIADRMIARGRSAATIAAFNELADRAGRSAAARGVFDFVVCALDRHAPDFIELLALAPSIGLETALPMLLETAASNGNLASPHVLRTCADRCSQAPTSRLARALLAAPPLTEALADRHAPWVVQQLRTHGFGIWDDVARHLEHALDVRVSARVLDCVDFDNAEEAAFLARHFDLFAGAHRDDVKVLPRLLRHLDWRVRAALAEALGGPRVLGDGHVRLIVERLARDDDYKVRAAVGRAIGAAGPAVDLAHVRALLADGNWHVRERTLRGVLSGPREPLPDRELADTVVASIAGDGSWRSAPAPVAKLLTRLRLLHGDHAGERSALDGTALFELLRETRTGWIELPGELERALIARGHDSARWLTVREAHAARRRESAASAREAYRKRRGRRSVQVALDVHDLDRAIEIATAAAEAGVDFIEVGDPLIKRVGVEAVDAVKRHAPEVAVVAEMMSADWGRDQVELAAEAGADVVLLIGPASIASVSAAVGAARRLGVVLTLDAPSRHVDPSWLRDMERAGIDGFVVTTNIDLGVGGTRPLAAARTIRACSELPVAVSGGFGIADDALTGSADWDIAIVGRGVAEAVTPADMLHRLTALIHTTHHGTRS
ncbi:hypothetical protein DPM19_09640 [Actinomadura craniellae]|uniref:HTH cro/C1-type domain-containing protein n=1 Tax=Actinomadura craniellae TaxID=2231787 RepID=A0A365H9P9_9ACTN|nr:orotidine 5'-phosphate decarboxylase / HUMPS family protein [Actinomadura craniellae]RAY15003.1 hypothetical protein DPM19_09640 [Actinomadura craniellae]